MHTTIFTNNIQCICRQFDIDDCHRYAYAIIDLEQVPEQYHKLLYNEIPIAFYDRDDTIHYTKQGHVIYVKFKNQSDQNLVIKARLDEEKGILYMTYKTSHPELYHVSFYVDKELKLREHGCDQHIDLMNNTIYDIPTEYQDTVVYDLEYYYTNVF
jgi:hypothetical protein